jgi:hypothetical protein
LQTTLEIVNILGWPATPVTTFSHDALTVTVIDHHLHPRLYGWPLYSASGVGPSIQYNNRAGVYGRPVGCAPPLPPVTNTEKHGGQRCWCVLCAGAGFLLWELSTPFVHLRWLLLKSGRDKQKLYATNGLLMMVVFFLCRPVWGTWLSYKVGLRCRLQQSTP